MKQLSHALSGALVVVSMGLALAGTAYADDRSDTWYLGGGLGGFRPHDDSALSGQSGKFSLGFGGGYRATPYVGVEADLLYGKQDIDTPSTIVPGALATADSRANLHTAGLGGLVKFYLPLDRVDLFAGGGLGLYTSTLYVKGTNSLGASADVTAHDTNVGYQLVLGADVFVANHVSVGLEYRWLKLDANFEPYVQGNINTGGQFLLATVRGHF